MALRTTTKTGNWSDPTVWNGGTTIPEITDTVSLGHQVVLDMDVTVVSISCSVNINFMNVSGIRTITANFILTSTTNLEMPTLSMTSNTNLTINGNISSSQTGVPGGNIITVDIDRILTINGNILGRTGSGGTLSTLGSAIIIQGGVVNINGSVIGNSFIGGYNVGTSLYNSTLICLSGILIVNGNLTGGSYVSVGYNVHNTALYAIGGDIQITGDCIGNASSAILIEGVPTIRVDGNIIGGSTYGHGIWQRSGVHYLTVNGYVQGSTGYGVYSNTTNTLTINGNCRGGGVYAATNSITNINGNQVNYGTRAGVTNASTGTVNIYGNLNGSISTSNPSNGYCVLNSGAGTVNINGNVLMNDVIVTTTTGLVRNTGTGKVTITGKTVGGTIANAIAVSNESTGEVEIRENCKSGTLIGTYGYYSTTASKLTVLGNVIADGCPAVYSSSQIAVTIFKGNIVNNQSISAIFAYNLNICYECAQVWSMFNGANTIQYATSNAEPSQPLVRDVELGTVYGSSNQYTGTMNRPPNESVFKNVPVGQELGTLETSAQGVWDIDMSLLTQGIGLYVKNLATDASVASTIAALE